MLLFYTVQQKRLCNEILNMSIVASGQWPDCNVSLFITQNVHICKICWQNVSMLIVLQLNNQWSFPTGFLLLLKASLSDVKVNSKVSVLSRLSCVFWLSPARSCCHRESFALSCSGMSTEEFRCVCVFT